MTQTAHFHWARWGDVRIYKQGKRLGWQISVQEILQHVMTCDKECPLLGITLDKLFTIIPESQQQAA